MSGVEGAERQDYDECEAGVALPAQRKNVNHEGTRVHEGDR